MADYINRIVLKGRLGKKPELRYLPSGDAVANFSLATKYGDHVEWHAIVAYKAMAERSVTFDQGDMVYIEGRIQTREFQTAEDKTYNRKRKVTEIIAETLNLVQKKGANDPEQKEQAQQFHQPTQLRAPIELDGDTDNTDHIPAYI